MVISNSALNDDVSPLGSADGVALSQDPVTGPAPNNACRELRSFALEGPVTNEDVLSVNSAACQIFAKPRGDVYEFKSADDGDTRTARFSGGGTGGGGIRCGRLGFKGVLGVI